MAEILKIFENSLKKSKAEQTELVCEKEEFYLSRFSENKINANVGRNDRTIWCRAIVGKKIGIAKTNILAQEAVDDLVNRALEICSQQNDDPQFSGLVYSPPTNHPGGYFESTAKFSAMAKAQAIKSIVDIAQSHNLETSGMFQNSATELTVANSLGTVQQGKVTEARLSVTLSGDNDDRAGSAQACARDVSQFDYKAIAQFAAEKASRSTSPIELTPGQYTVILEPEAVADFLLFLGFLGFGGKGMVSGRGFMADKIGQQIMSSSVTITEDPFNPVMAYMPFDYEGLPRQTTPLVENGMAMGAVYDSYYAALKSTQSTGNALPPDNKFGPYPKTMVMNPGQKLLAEIIASSDNAIFINHFWYLNYVNPMKTMVTATTRDGTFMIENGQVGAPVKDIRIMQSMLESFNNIETVSSDRRLVYKFGVLMYVPALKINNFNFVPSE